MQKIKPQVQWALIELVNISNLKLAKDKMNMKVSKATICRILNKEYGKPRKIKKVFFLNKNQKEKR